MGHSPAIAQPESSGAHPPAPAWRALADQLPPEMAIAAAGFVTGSLLENPRRIGTPLRDALAGIHCARLGRDWRILFEVNEARHLVIVLDIQHRSSAYRALELEERSHGDQGPGGAAPSSSGRKMRTEGVSCR